MLKTACLYRTPCAFDRFANIRRSEQREDVARTNFSAHQTPVTAGELRRLPTPSHDKPVHEAPPEKISILSCAAKHRASGWHVSKLIFRVASLKAGFSQPHVRN